MASPRSNTPSGRTPKIIPSLVVNPHPFALPDAAASEIYDALRVDVTFAGIQETTLNGREALAATFAIQNPDPEKLWAYFEREKENFAEFVAAEVIASCGDEYEVAEVHYKQGSLIITVFIAVKTWAIAHQSLLQFVAYALSLYQPLKTLLSDAKRWTTRLCEAIKGFFRRRSQRPRVVGLSSY